MNWNKVPQGSDICIVCHQQTGHFEVHESCEEFLEVYGNVYNEYSGEFNP